MDYTCISFGILFTMGGFVFATGNGHTHLPAWKNMAPEEKEKIAIVPLCRNIGEIIALNGIIFLLKGLWTGFSDHWFVGAMVAWMIIQPLSMNDHSLNEYILLYSNRVSPW